MTRTHLDGSAGIGLIDVVLTLVFVFVVLLVAVPAMHDAGDEIDTKRVLHLVARLENACARHLRDTGRPAIEFAPPEADHAWNESRYHQLSRRQLSAGWAGPYLDHQITLADNPGGGAVCLRNDLGDYPAHGFELGDGELTVGEGQYVSLERIPVELARRVDAALDGEESSLWASHGRVEYREDDGGTLSIWLLGRDQSSSTMPK